MTQETRLAFQEIDTMLKTAGWHERQAAQGSASLAPEDDVREQILREVSEVLAVPSLPATRLEELRAAVHRVKEAAVGCG